MTSQRKFPGCVFVSAEDIKHCLDDFTIFDVRFKLNIPSHGPIEFAKAHAANALAVDLERDLCAAPPHTTGGRHPMRPVEPFLDWCQAKGVRADRPVLCYDDDCGGMGACRLWWMLDSLGQEVYVLDGGIQAYVAAGLPTATGPDTHPDASLSTPRLQAPSCYAKLLSLEALPPNLTPVDARAAHRFASTVRPFAADVLPGHLDGAVNLPYTSHMTEGSGVRVLRPKPALLENVRRALLGDGAAQDAPLDLSQFVFHCGSGITATVNIAVVRHLGLGEVLFYGGSWSEYESALRYAITRRIVDKHGLWVEMLSASRDANAAVELGKTSVVIDGAAPTVLAANDGKDDEVAAAAVLLRAGEKARVYFRGGRVVVIEVLE